MSDVAEYNTPDLQPETEQNILAGLASVLFEIYNQLSPDDVKNKRITMQQLVNVVSQSLVPQDILNLILQVDVDNSGLNATTVQSRDVPKIYPTTPNFNIDTARAPGIYQLSDNDLNYPPAPFGTDDFHNGQLFSINAGGRDAQLIFSTDSMKVGFRSANNVTGNFSPWVQSPVLSGGSFTSGNLVVFDNEGNISDSGTVNPGQGLRTTDLPSFDSIFLSGANSNAVWFRESGTHRFAIVGNYSEDRIELFTYDDAGAFRQNVLQIPRDSAGLVNIARPVEIDDRLSIDGTGNTAVGLEQNNVDRFDLIYNATNDAYQIDSKTDAGAYRDTPLQVPRAADGIVRVQRWLLVTGNIVASNGRVTTGSASGSDNRALTLSGAGTADTARGATIFVYGNDNTSPLGGSITCQLGRAANSRFAVQVVSPTGTTENAVEVSHANDIEISRDIDAGTNSITAGNFIGKLNGRTIHVSPNDPSSGDWENKDLWFRYE